MKRGLKAPRMNGTAKAKAALAQKMMKKRMKMLEEVLHLLQAVVRLGSAEPGKQTENHSSGSTSFLSAAHVEFVFKYSLLTYYFDFMYPKYISLFLSKAATFF